MRPRLSCRVSGLVLFSQTCFNVPAIRMFSDSHCSLSMSMIVIIPFLTTNRQKQLDKEMRSAFIEKKFSDMMVMDRWTCRRSDVCKQNN